MVARSASFLLLATFLSATASQAGGAVEPGSPLKVSPPRQSAAPAAEPSSRGWSLSRFLDSPGKDEGRLQLWLRFNREARGIEEGARDFLETLSQLTAQASSEVIYSHERVQLEAELLLAQQEVDELTDARTELLDDLGKVDPDHAILEGEVAPPWSPDEPLDREALSAKMRSVAGERVFARLQGVERRLDAVEQELLPAAEESLGSALLALASGEATMLEVVHGLHFLKHQQRMRLELRTQRELLLRELARQAGCRVDQLPWGASPVAG
jgi:hypothetical protein